MNFKGNLTFESFRVGEAFTDLRVIFIFLFFFNDERCCLFDGNINMITDLFWDIRIISIYSSKSDWYRLPSFVIMIKNVIYDRMMYIIYGNKNMHIEN